MTMPLHALARHDFAHFAFGPQIDDTRPVESAIVTRLRSFVRLGVDEVDALERLAGQSRIFQSEKILIHEGTTINSVCLIVKGLAYRYKMLAGGRRQILGYLIPGDVCDIQFAISNRPDYSVALIGSTSITRISTSSLDQLITQYPKIGRALSLAAIMDSAILREWLLGVGQRDALQKLSHFFCEMSVRMDSVGGVSDEGSFDLPVNQATLADSLGMTTTHVNRTLQRLRHDGLIELRNRKLSILDSEGLATLAGFDGTYLRMKLMAC